MTLPPITTVWDADGFCWRPLPRYHNLLGDRLGDGEVMDLVEHHDRSDATHKHAFAWLKEAWRNLPEEIAYRFANADELRKFALIQTGFRTVTDRPCKTQAEAERTAASISAVLDSYAVVVVDGSIVRVLRAESQSYQSMGRARFQESKTAILDYIAGMIGVDPAELGKQQEAA